MAAIFAIETDYRGALDDALRDELSDFVNYEVEIAKTQLEDELPDDVTVNSPAQGDVDSILDDVAFNGRYVDNWISDFSDADYKRVRDAVQAGVQADSGLDAILSGLAGGAFLVGNRQLENITRGIFNGAKNWARLLTWEANPDIVEYVQWIATLDEDTCPICMDLDGQIIPADEVDPPPIHLSCRCDTVPVLASFERLARMSKLIHTHPKRHLFTGKPATKLRYAAWLRRQSEATQDEALGPTRAKLFREGGLTISRFVNPRGPDGKPHILTLDELRKRDVAAFRRAGL
jgi:SPP1 gp7 family putative phage head morphogenesis protein